jgi:acetylornithine deacetylase
MGTLALVHRGYQAQAAFMPEPTGARIVPMCRGILWGEIIVRGRSSHIEIPQPDWTRGGAVNAIAKARYLLEAIDELNQAWAEHPEKTHPLLGVPNQMFVSMIKAGQHPSSWAEEAKITFDAQYTANERDGNRLGHNVKREIERHLEAVGVRDGWLAENPLRRSRSMARRVLLEQPIHEKALALLRENAEYLQVSGLYGSMRTH